jgi:aminoglycoside phosphotransferase (APT) family kinase protein
VDVDALAEVVGAPVDHLERLSGGASRETWRFEAGGRRLVVQRARGAGLGGQPGMEGEARLLRLAREAGVPVPEVVASGGAGGALGSPFLVTEAVEGETIPRRLLRDDEFAPARAVLAHQAGRALAAIHAMPTGPVGDVLSEPDPVRSMADLLGAFDEAHPAFELGVRWLDRHRPASHGRVVVHGDFRTGNLVVGPDGLRAVLDWELAHLGDPAEDLGWFCGRAWRFGSPHRAGGFGSLDELLAGYRAGGGPDVSEEDVRWWEAYGTLRWGIVCLVQVSSHLSGAVRSVEQATIGRRTAEAEWDLLELIS